MTKKEKEFENIISCVRWANAQLCKNYKSAREDTAREIFNNIKTIAEFNNGEITLKDIKDLEKVYYGEIQNNE